MARLTKKETSTFIELNKKKDILVRAGVPKSKVWAVLKKVMD